MSHVNVRSGNLGTWTCSACGKLSHQTRKNARAYAKRTLPGQNISAYLCELTAPGLQESWHIGHITPLVLRGVITRAEMGEPIPRPQKYHGQAR